MRVHQERKEKKEVKKRMSIYSSTCRSGLALILASMLSIWKITVRCRRYICDVFSHSRMCVEAGSEINAARLRIRNAKRRSSERSDRGSLVSISLQIIRNDAADERFLFSENAERFFSQQVRNIQSTMRSLAFRENPRNRFPAESTTKQTSAYAFDPCRCRKNQRD